MGGRGLRKRCAGCGRNKSITEYVIRGTLCKSCRGEGERMEAHDERYRVAMAEADAFLARGRERYGIPARSSRPLTNKR